MNMTGQDSGAGDMPLQLLLRNFAAELHALQRDGRDLENAIGQSILSGSASAGQTLSSLQGIDLIVQTLGELGDCMGQVAQMMQTEERLDMRVPLSGLSLRGLAENLSRKQIDDPMAPLRAPGGDVDLF